MLGNGKKLFDKGAKPAAFKLVDNRVTTTGVVIACYRRAGDVVTGDYAVAHVLGQTGYDPERLVTQLLVRPEGAAITRWYTGDAAGALDDALAAIAAAAKVGHQRAEMIGHHAAYAVAGELELFVPPSTLPDLPK